MARSLRIDVDERNGSVSALLERPEDAQALLVLAHGAGADMHHVFMEAIAAALAKQRIATLRYQFPYTEAGGRRPSPRKALLATVRAALAKGLAVAEGLPLFAGGKSMGGRMTSLCAAEPEALSHDAIAALRGVLFFGFPLHAAGKPPSRERAEHLFELVAPGRELPLLFLQGTRDKLAPWDEIEPLCRDLGAAATLHRVEGGDHGFHVLKRSGRSDHEVIDELAAAAGDFALRNG